MNLDKYAHPGNSNSSNSKLVYRGFFDSRDGGTLITPGYNDSTKFAGEQGSITSESIVVPPVELISRAFALFRTRNPMLTLAVASVG